MMQDYKERLRRLGVALGAALTVVAALFATPCAADEIELPPGLNRDLVYGACRTCHDLQYLTESAGITRDDWDAIIDSMRQYGLRIPPERRAKILDYLGSYLGPNPPPKAVAEAEAGPAKAPTGDKLFAEQCVGCHQQNGEGRPREFPPLAGNHDLMRDRLFPAYVLLNGLEGKIMVGPHEYNGQMPPFSHLTDAEIASIVRYIRSAWNNAALRPAKLQPVDAAAVKSARAKPMSPAEVHRYRARLQ